MVSPCSRSYSDYVREEIVGAPCVEGHVASSGHWAGINVSLTSNSTLGLCSAASFSFEPSFSSLYPTYPVLKLRAGSLDSSGSFPSSVEET